MTSPEAESILARLREAEASMEKARREFLLAAAKVNKLRESLIFSIRNSEQRFTARETEVLSLIQQGKANKEIAAELNISTRTVKSYVSKLIRNTHASNRVSLASMFSKENDVLTMRVA